MGIMKNRKALERILGDYELGSPPQVQALEQFLQDTKTRITIVGLIGVGKSTLYSLLLGQTKLSDNTEEDNWDLRINTSHPHWLLYDRQRITHEPYLVIYVKRDLAELLQTIYTERPWYLQNLLRSSGIPPRLTSDMEGMCFIFLEGQREDLGQFLATIPDQVVTMNAKAGKFHLQSRREESTPSNTHIEGDE